MLGGLLIFVQLGDIGLMEISHESFLKHNTTAKLLQEYFKLITLPLLRRSFHTLEGLLYALEVPMHTETTEISL